ncbi:MAG: hypothetical protein H0X37_08810, partial [Herpetosiphonaceae bacterium]|nr:hypothetical protein [Herpetosiphonaceae bacterium]
REASRDALEQLHSVGIEQVGSVQSLSAAAGSMSFPIWAWFPQSLPPAATPRFRAATFLQPSFGNTPTILEGPSNNAVGFGIAIELTYDVGDHALSILEGPAADLRHLLQQTIPDWTSAERRTIAIQGHPQDVWVMRGAREGSNEYDRRIVFEWHDTLFFMHTIMSDADLETVLSHLSDFQQVGPAQQP